MLARAQRLTTISSRSMTYPSEGASVRPLKSVMAFFCIPPFPSPEVPLLVRRNSPHIAMSQSVLPAQSRSSESEPNVLWPTTLPSRNEKYVHLLSLRQSRTIPASPVSDLKRSGTRLHPQTEDANTISRLIAKIRVRCIYISELDCSFLSVIVGELEFRITAVRGLNDKRA